MKRVLILLFLVILLAGSVGAAIKKEYRLFGYDKTSEGTSYWHYIPTPDGHRDYGYKIIDLYKDDGDLYILTEGKKLITANAAGAGSTDVDFLGFTPYHINKFDEKIYIYGHRDWGTPVGPSLYYYESGNWKSGGIGNGRVEGVAYRSGNYLAAFKPYAYAEYFLYSSYQIPYWRMIAQPIYKGPIMRIYTSSNYFYMPVIIEGRGNLCMDYYGNIWGEVAYRTFKEIGGARFSKDLEAIRINSTTERLFAIDFCKNYLYTYDVVRSSTGFKSTQYSVVSFYGGGNFVEYNNNEEDKKIIITNGPYIFEITPDLIPDNYNNVLSGTVKFNFGANGKFTALEAKGNAIYAAVEYTCVDSDNDKYSGTDITILGDKICGELDCGDGDATIYPGAPELCDGKDNDCDADAVVDEGCECITDTSQSCGSDIGECDFGSQICVNGQWGMCGGGVMPVNEICDDNNKDNDCDGLADCADSDCLSSGLCSCTTDSECGDGNVCDIEQDVCVLKCTSDADCGTGKKCDTTTNHCYTPTPLPLIISCDDVKTYCDDEGLSTEDCIRVCNGVDVGSDGSIFDCYWDDGYIFGIGSACNEITPTTSCSDLTYPEVCGGNIIIDCKWENDECVESEGVALPSLGCPEGTYPQLNGNCGGSVDLNAGTAINCDSDLTCDPGEVCGCSDCIHKIDAGGCQIDYWCSESGACVDISLEPEVRCEDLKEYGGKLYSDCPDGTTSCISDYWALPSNALFDVDGDGEKECCFGDCWDGTYVFDSTTGNLIMYIYGQCIPLESGGSVGSRTVTTRTTVNGVVEETPMEPESCTILPSRKVPFSSALGILIGLVIIIGFYLLRKKH